MVWARLCIDFAIFAMPCNADEHQKGRYTMAA